MITYLITGITVVVSFICFNNRLLFDKLSLKPYRIVHAKEWYRIISHGFVHADWVHLFVNMFTFWSFGKYIEETFRYLGFGEGAFLLLYFGGMVVASASDVIRYRNAAWYTSIGASGAVSAVLFTAIFPVAENFQSFHCLRKAAVTSKPELRMAPTLSLYGSNPKLPGTGTSIIIPVVLRL